jgi:hypothetical protein
LEGKYSYKLQKKKTMPLFFSSVIFEIKFIFRMIHTFAHAFASPSNVTYLEPEMLKTCLLAFGLLRTLINTFAKSYLIQNTVNMESIVFICLFILFFPSIWDGVALIYLSLFLLMKSNGII